MMAHDPFVYLAPYGPVGASLAYGTAGVLYGPLWPGVETTSRFAGGVSTAGGPRRGCRPACSSLRGSLSLLVLVYCSSHG